MNIYGSREESISIPVEEYKELLAAKMELDIIYRKLENCTDTTEKYTFYQFVQDMHEALHPAQPDVTIPVPVVPGMVEPLAAMHAEVARSANA